MSNSFDLPNDYQPYSKPCSELYVQAMRELADPAPSVKTNRFKSFDTITGGFRAHEFSILCGATGVGKTTFLANLSSALIAEKVPHFVASVETGATDFIKRVLSVFGRKDMNTGESVSLGDLKKVNAEYGQLLSEDYLHLSLHEDRFGVHELMADIEWHVKNHGIKVAFVDNLNFILDVTTAEKQILEMDRVIHELIIFCKKTDVHVVMVMHPKKTDSGRVLSEFDIKGSSTAVQESHNVFLLNRARQELIQAQRCQFSDRELYIAKMRRKGKFVGKTLIFKSANGAGYEEGDLL